ncbi:hypothetical protein NM208_g11179 [Fusarium decemcellulare]|uniref:Uncharacterized protein n=1 Tax=Fusarium decemcellulare TaxID=57161 RepID=A0ACC1RV86_9HYPO|nr:hypothetical protein NM208_g11179 [Fusarium decemcellulare]
MPVDYSKWDALELSDDSDIEVHPNVDKRSFIRAKQNQIHQERQQRKLQIETLNPLGLPTSSCLGSCDQKPGRGRLSGCHGVSWKPQG